MRLHALEQIKAKIQVPRIFCIEREKPKSLRAQAGAWGTGGRAGSHHGRIQPLERIGKNLSINFFFAAEMKVKRTRCVAGALRNFPNAGAFKALILEYMLGGVQYRIALMVAKRALPVHATVMCCD